MVWELGDKIFEKMETEETIDGERLSVSYETSVVILSPSEYKELLEIKMKYEALEGEEQ